jgi:hypothetical protein
MPKSKPRWGEPGDLSHGGAHRAWRWRQRFPDDVRRELAHIIDTDSKTETRFIERLWAATQTHRWAKERRSGPYREPTIGEKQAAATELSGAARDLARKLELGAGGLDYDIERKLTGSAAAVQRNVHAGVRDYLPKLPYLSQQPEKFIPDLAVALHALADVCDKLLSLPPEDFAPASPLHNPKRLLARLVAKEFRRVLREEPSGHCSTDYEQQRGKYARVLATLFVHFYGREPGDLPKLVKWGARYRRGEDFPLPDKER